MTNPRQLNDVTIKDAYPLTNIKESLKKLKGAKIFTSIDACGAYHAIQIEEGSRDCTAFISHFSTFLYIRMPFDVSNFGSVYTRMFDLALAHLPVEYRLSYLVDNLVYSMDTWDHLKHLKSIMEAHTKAGIKIQPKRTKIFQTETEYLGHKVSQGEVQMLDQYVKDIQSLPRPTSCKEMLSFLAFTGYERGFIPRYSALNNRMNSLKKDFLELKGEFSEWRIQAYPDFDSDEPFILTTDWSSLNIAGVLSQKQEGVERFLGCWGRRCNCRRDTIPGLRESSSLW